MTRPQKKAFETYLSTYGNNHQNHQMVLALDQSNHRNHLHLLYLPKAITQSVFFRKCSMTIIAITSALVVLSTNNHQIASSCGTWKLKHAIACEFFMFEKSSRNTFVFYTFRKQISISSAHSCTLGFHLLVITRRQVHRTCHSLKHTSQAS